MAASGGGGDRARNKRMSKVEIKAAKKRARVFQPPIGYSAGLPMWHLFTGNAPIISQDFWVPPAGENAEDAAKKAYNYYTGNVTVQSREFHIDESSIMDPQWVELVDPKTGKKFWWHRRYRSRREEKPDLTDDGRAGAFDGDEASAGPKWTEAWSPEHKRCYYVNNRALTTTWDRPPDFISTGVAYEPIWERVKSKDGTKYYNRLTDEFVDEKPSDYDGEAIGSGAPGPDVPTPEIPEELLESLKAMRSGLRRYHPISGWLEKKGGGSSLFGRSSWQSRWIIVRDGLLQYFKTEVAAKKHEARKDVVVDLDNYNVDPKQDSKTEFALLPIVDKTTAAATADPKHSPEPTRTFIFRAKTNEDKVRWVNALMDTDSPFASSDAPKN